MSEIDVQNLGFKVVHDTVIDSGVLSGLVEAGVIPKSFRVIKGEVDFLGGDNAGVEGSYAVLDSSTGKQVLLSTGEQIVFLSAVATTDIADAVNFGLGLNPLEAAIGTATQTDLVTEAAVAGVNAGVNPIPAAAAVTVVGADVWLQASITGTATAGVVQVVVVVV
jgi:hypothetical protein